MSITGIATTNERPRAVELVRDIIEIQSVKVDLLENNIGYIRLTSFNENSSEQIKS